MRQSLEHLAQCRLAMIFSGSKCKGSVNYRIPFSHISHFINFQDCIQRVQDLQTEGKLTGVIDDRGKFIYITMEELESVAKYIRQLGRVSITELAESSNRLINLNPDNADIQKKLIVGDNTEVAVS